VGVAWLCCGGGGVDWLVKVHFRDVSAGWVFQIFDDGGEDLDRRLIGWWWIDGFLRWSFVWVQALAHSRVS
jgi:hypothetical protein